MIDDPTESSWLYFVRKDGKSTIIKFATDKDLKHYLFNYVSQSPHGTSNPVMLWKAQLQNGNSMEWKGPAERQ